MAAHKVVAAGLRKAFGGNVAIANLDFEGQAGEVHALLGENGAGKSTFINVLSGALRPDAGSLSIFGHDVVRFSLREARRCGVSTVFQELAVVPDLTVAENVWLGREPLTPVRLISRAQLRRRTDELLKRWEIGGVDPSDLLGSLSLGKRQQVAIARALSLEPRVLILDEATSALAATETDWLIKTARRVADSGALVLFVSHRLPEVRAVADRLTVMRNGETVTTGAVEDISDAELVKAMLGRSPGRLYPPKSSRPPGEELLKVSRLRSGTRLRGIEFTLHAGEIVGLSGIQGQGQMELLSALVGLIPAQGETFVGGRKRTLWSPAAALAAGSGIVLLPVERQSEGLLLSKSIKDNVSLSAISNVTRLGVIRRASERQLVQNAVEDVQLRYSDLDQPVWQLSGGNQQKVVLSRLLTTKAQILLLADPVRGVDVGAKAEIFTIMRKLADAGHAILFYSTDIQELVNVADRVLVMSRGTIVASLEGEDLNEEAVLGAAVMTKTGT